MCRVNVCCSMFMLGLRQKRMELRQAGPFMCFSKIKQANIFSGIHVQRAEIGTWENCCAFALTRWPRHLDQSIKWLSSHQTCPPCDACGFNLGLILVLLAFVWILQGLIWPLFCLDLGYVAMLEKAYIICLWFGLNVDKLFDLSNSSR